MVFDSTIIAAVGGDVTITSVQDKYSTPEPKPEPDRSRNWVVLFQVGASAVSAEERSPFVSVDCKLIDRRIRAKAEST